MHREILKDIRTLAGAAIAPVICMATSALFFTPIDDYLARTYPWSLSGWIWPHAGMRGDTFVPVWLMPSVAHFFVIVWCVGVPSVLILRRFGLVSARHFISVGAFVGLLVQLVMLFSYLLYAGVNLESLAEWEPGGLGGFLHETLPMMVNAAACGLAIGFSFWLIAVRRNPRYVV